MGAKLEKIFDHIMTLATITLVVLAVYQVFSRYVLGTSISWTEETMRNIYVMLIMLSVYYLTKENNAATITFFSDFVGQKSKILGRILYLFQTLVQMIFYALLFYYGARLCMQAGNKFTFTTGIPFTIIYFPLPLGGLMGFINTGKKYLASIR